VLIVTLEGQQAFYKTATTNHTNNMTYPVPPRTALIGKLGAAMGLTYDEAMSKFWERKQLKTSFRWATKTRIQPIGMNQIMYEGGFINGQ
jgi:CRISPR-associated Cas5-like protein